MLHRTNVIVMCVLMLVPVLSACGDNTAKSATKTPDMSVTDAATDAGFGDDAAANNVQPDMPNGPDTGNDPDLSSPPDMGADVTINPALCGNSMPDPGEQCDDGNDDDTDECNADCTLTCGDGVVSAVERCDINIPMGMPGACPSACDDGNACTTDTLDGTACAAQCVTGDITACSDGDGCCPSTCDNTNDNDCAAVCGNGVVEATETCDGNCPATCDDGVACTADSMAGTDATCDIVCTNSVIAACVNGDGCCPSTCTSANDDDCSATCGNNTIEPPETCDGNCPTSNADCADNDVCTADTLSGSAAQCNAMCVNAPLGCRPNLNDGCCPANCNATTDADCSAMCGNNAVEAGEQCDDGNTADGDGCDSGCQLESGIAFRMSDLDLMDPHVYISFFGCRDITNSFPAGLSRPINGMLQDAITLDEDNDGELDLSFVAIFGALDQSHGATGAVTIAEADCTAPMSTTTCTVDPTSSTFQTGGYRSDTMMDCLDAFPGTTRPYTPAIGASLPPCFASTPVDLTIDFSGILVPLTDVQVAASYIGNPATALGNGLLRGFISEADADAILLPDDMPVIGGDPLSSVLPGGQGACPSHDDRDVGPDGITMGWWFYLNFPADQVPVTIL